MPYFVILIVAVSALLQLTAAALALRLMRLSGRRWAWVLIALGLTLMACRRGLSLAQYGWWEGQPYDHWDLASEAVGLATSALMALGVVLISKMFRQFNRVSLDLQQSEERYRSIFEQCRDGILLTSPRGLIEDLNPAALTILGQDRGHLLGRDLAEVCASLELVDGLGVRQGTPWDEYEANVHRPDGQDRLCTLSPSPRLAQDGTSLGNQLLLRDITARRRMEWDLINSQRKLSKIFDSSPVWIVLSTLEDGRILEANDAFLRSTGYSRAEIKDKTSLELGLWDDPAQRRALVEMVRAKGFARGMEVRRRDKAGRLRLMLWSGELMEVGGRMLLLSSSQDISELKRAEQDLRESKETLDAILASSPVGIALVKDEAVAWANQALKAMLGYGQDEDLPPLEALVQSEGETLEALVLRMRRALSLQTQGSMDLGLRGKDGQVLEVFLQAQALDPADIERGVIVSVTDITQRKAALKALSESEEKYRLVVDKADEAICIVQDGALHFPNPKTLAVSGRSPGELAQTGLAELFHPDDRPAISAMLATVMAGGVTAAVPTLRLLGPQGELRWLEVNLVPISWQGQPAALCLGRDLTTQKSLERQLWQAQKMEAIGRLAGGVAHDFNNLLTVINGHSEQALAQAGPDKELRRRLKAVREAGAKAAALTRQLLTFSSRHLAARQVMDLNAVVNGLTSMIGPLLGEQISAQVNLAPDLWPVKGDPGQMEQVLMNLVVNARDAMPLGGALTIDTRNLMLGPEQLQGHIDLSPGPHVMLSVSDSGCGMDQRTLSHLFEPFFTTKEKGKGTGLGLSTAYGIIKRAGGSISVFSEPARGTAFEIYLPVDQESRRGEAKEPEVNSCSLETRGSETVLVVEDEPELLAFVAEALAGHGYQVLKASNPLQALEMLSNPEEPVQLLLTDISLPRMTGLALAREAQRLEPELRMVYMSGYTDLAPRENQGLGEARHFLQKPFTVIQLAALVRQALDSPPAPVSETTVQGVGEDIPRA